MNKTYRPMFSERKLRCRRAKRKFIQSNNERHSRKIYNERYKTRHISRINANSSHRNKTGSNPSIITETVRAANDTVHLLKSPTFDAYYFFQSEEEQLAIECFHSLDPSTLQWAFQLCKENVREMYEATIGWNEEHKFTEMTEDGARYLIARKLDTCEPVAFSHFRFDMDYGEEVLYCYELHVIPEAQGKGLGKFLLSILELLAFSYKMSKVILTVFKANEGGLRFYRKCNYEEDHTSPDDCPYLILSKYEDDWKRLS